MVDRKRLFTYQRLKMKNMFILNDGTRIHIIWNSLTSAKILLNRFYFKF